MNKGCDSAVLLEENVIASYPQDVMDDPSQAVVRWIRLAVQDVVQRILLILRVNYFPCG